VSRPVTTLAAVLAVLVLTTGAAWLTRPQPHGHRDGVASRVPVTQASALCPDPRTPGDDFGVDVQALTPRVRGTGLSRGTATIGALTKDGTHTLQRVAGPGQPASVTMKAGDAPAAAVEGSHSLAPGLTAEEHSRVPGGDQRGLSSGVCAPPGTDFWFVGGGSQVGQRTSVLLTNADVAPAQVDVTVYGEHGQLDAPAGHGVVVPAHGQKSLRLDALSPGSAATVVHVQVQTGRLSAAVHDSEVDGLTPRGTDWVPVAAEPGRHPTVTGFVAGKGTRSLRLLVPGATDAVVHLRVITPDRSFVPAGKEVVEARSGHVTTVDLSHVLDGQAGTVELSSDQPLVAGADMRSGGRSGVSDAAFATAVPALSGPTAVLGNRGGKGVTSTLCLTAPDDSGSVTVATFGGGTKGGGAGSQPSTRTVKVPAKSMVTVPLKGGSTPFAAVVSPGHGSGPVYAARTVTEDDADAPLVTVQSLRTSRTFVAVPDVAADVATGLR